MTPVSHPGRVARIRPDATTRPNLTDARCEALFASGLQRSDAPTAAMAAQAIKTSLQRFGIRGCASRMAQESGDHPDAAAQRMRSIRQLTAQPREARHEPDV
jgi:hypothetical protein